MNLVTNIGEFFNRKDALIEMSQYTPSFNKLTTKLELLDTVKSVIIKKIKQTTLYDNR